MSVGGAVCFEKLDKGHLDYTLRGHLWVQHLLTVLHMHKGGLHVWECMLKGGRRCYSLG